MYDWELMAVCFFYCNLLLAQAKLIEAYIFWKKKKWFKLIYQSRMRVRWCLCRSKILYVCILFHFCVYIYLYIYIYIRMDNQEVGYGYMDWVGLVQYRYRWWTLVSAIMKFQVSWNGGNFLTSCKTVSFGTKE